MGLSSVLSSVINNIYPFHILYQSVEDIITEAAWCQDIDCGTSVAKKMCPTTCQVGGKLILNCNH